MPGGHAIWFVALQKKPAGHNPHTVAPADENRPGEQSATALNPVWLQNDPAGQVTHVENPTPGAYCPVEHGVLALRPVTAHADPALHDEHVDAAPVENVPTLQLIGLEHAAGQ